MTRRKIRRHTNTRNTVKYRKKIIKTRRIPRRTRQNTRRNTRILRGGYNQTQVLNFRQMFMNSFSVLQKAVNTGSSENIKNAIKNFKNGLNGNKNGINTLIPVNNQGIPVDKYTESSGLTSLVPPLVVIFHNIPDMSIRDAILTAFMKYKDNGFDINLTNYRKDKTVLLEAIELHDKRLIELLIKKGANTEMLTEEQKANMESILNQESKVEPTVEPIVEPTVESKVEPKVEPIVDTVISSKPFVKLNIELELPSEPGYNPEIEPEFWQPIFDQNEMFAIRKLINDIMITDGNIPVTNNKITRAWSICEIVKTIIPTFYTPIENNPYILFGTFFKDTDVDFSKFNVLLCSALIIFGIISYKMIGQDYKMLFKGGKAIQLALSRIPNMSEYRSDDIDVLIMPDKNIPYDELRVKNLAGHLGYLIRWFLNIHEPDSEPGYKVSVQVPNPINTKANQYIFKLSYIKSLKRKDYRKQVLIDDYKQFLDIDFKKVSRDMISYFQDDLKEYNFEISLSSDTKQNLLFICPNLGSLLNEKIYYYVKYFKFKQILQNKKTITEDGYQAITIDECDRFLEKFKRAILVMNKGLQIQRQQPKEKQNQILHYDTLASEKESIKKRVNNFGFINEDFQSKIVDSLYPSA